MSLNGERGFSLLEVLLSMAIIGVLAGVSLPIYNSFVVRNDLDLTTQQVANILRRAQTYARGMKDDSGWGVRIQSSSVTLYKGSSFTGRNTNFDEILALSSSTATGLGDVQFAKLTAAPNTTGSITLTSNANDIRTVTLNAKGVVSY